MLTGVDQYVSQAQQIKEFSCVIDIEKYWVCCKTQVK
jgi:hypothetical protein